MRLSAIKINFIILCSILLSAGTLSAQNILKIERIAICTSVEDRQPVGEADVFVDTTGSLYCYTEIRGMGDATSISHVWYHGTNRRAEVKLNVQGYRWRTWSSKVIQLDWTGDWRVDVVSADGKILKSKRFRIVETGIEPVVSDSLGSSDN